MSTVSLAAAARRRIPVANAGAFDLPAADGPAPRPWSLLLWFVIPAWCLLWLWLNPPHTLDLAIERNFYDGSGWPWHGFGAMQFWLHLMPKVLTGIVFALVGAAAWYLQSVIRAADRAGDLEEAARSRGLRLRLLSAVAGGALCVTVVWWLKQSTGVACPWNVEAFGGTSPVNDPSFPLLPRPGSCWPSGAAGSGYALLPVFFALRDTHPRAARAMLALAIALGTAAGVARMLSGAHFLSHIPAAFLTDWLISAAVYVLMIDRRGLAAKFLALGKTGNASRPSLMKALPLVNGLWWALVLDVPMIGHLLTDGGRVTASSLMLAGLTLAALACLSTALIELLAMLPRKLFLAVLTVLNLLGALAFASAFLYSTAMTPDMVRNFIETDPREATGYLSARAAFVFASAFLPMLLLALHAAAQKPVKPLASLGRRAALRTLRIALLVAAGLAAIGLNFQPFAGAMRADKSLRYQIAPVNVLWSTAMTFVADESASADRPRVQVDPAPALTVPVKGPTVLVVAVGETTRSANWQLSGYARETTPELAKLPLIHFDRVEACGTSTDVSLPCMMSRIGRSDYDRSRILAEESLPSLLSRAGANVLWIDNQSGCKGTCAGVENFTLTPEIVEGFRKGASKSLCPDGACRDLALAEALRAELPHLPTDRPTVIFLHMTGSHGPAYFERSTGDEKAFGPECLDPALSGCTRESVVNAYDNSVRATDRAVAEMIRTLEADRNADTALIFLSDHGESLGESGLWLHGAPWLMRPAEQVEVPMALWMSEGFPDAMGLDEGRMERLRGRAAGAGGKVTQESLYHTVLGLLGVSSVTYRPDFDLSR
ncbi:sulfatase-like hydrolase/transferase [Sutterella sp.]|uniref:sulfatase-like hydrolase/transferase n=1 Tax=Sutterella sp. TaxID=1981025 RepID=UPI0026DFB4F3|nr:sulfatase-like hydrolase/transferase [Sutterella sp.]MDO5530764.1 sulfatase-like hydrolase/transferase [Sutterella sp.]